MNASNRDEERAGHANQAGANNGTAPIEFPSREEAVNAATQDPAEYKPLGTCSYSPEDNKLRLTPFDRLDPETYARVKTAGFIWAPKQRILIAPMWTPDREDIALELCGAIGDEDTSLVERAEERADRFEDYSEKRAADADRAHAAVEAIGGNIPLGQPILIGHHSQRRAERDAQRIKAGMRKAVSLWETSKYWQDRAKGAVRAAKYKERPDVRYRRIKGLESDKRKQLKRIDEAEHYTKAWNAQPVTRERAMKIANFDSTRLPSTEALPYGDTVWSALDKGTITPEDAYSRAIAKHEQTIADARRWLAHFDNRLAYERAMLDESAAEGGGVVTQHHNVEVGGKVLAKHWRTKFREEWLVVKRVNKGGDNGVVSVSTPSGVIPIEDVKGYEPPTAENVEKVKAASTLPPLINYPAEGCATWTMAEWNARKGSDMIAVRKVKATAEHGAHRQREIVRWRRMEVQARFPLRREACRAPRTRPGKGPGDVRTGDRARVGAGLARGARGRHGAAYAARSRRGGVALRADEGVAQSRGSGHLRPSALPNTGRLGRQADHPRGWRDADRPRSRTERRHGLHRARGARHWRTRLGHRDQRAPRASPAAALHRRRTTP